MVVALAETLSNLYLRGEMPKARISFVYLGYACVISLLEEYTLVFDPADMIGEEEIDKLRKPIITLYTHAHDDHFHARTALRLYEMKASFFVSNPEVHRTLMDFLPSHSCRVLEPRRGVRVGPLRIFAIGGSHAEPSNIYYVVSEHLRVIHGDSSGYVDLSKLSADVAFMPTGSPSLDASPENAARMARDVKARYAVAIHGTEEQMNEFKSILERECPSCRALVPEVGRYYELGLE